MNYHLLQEFQDLRSTLSSPKHSRVASKLRASLNTLDSPRNSDTINSYGHALDSAEVGDAALLLLGA